MIDPRSHVIQIQQVTRIVLITTEDLAQKIQELEGELYDMDTFSAFQDLLNSELVTDVLNRHLIVAKDAFLKSQRELEAVLSPVTGSNDWKAQFDGSEPLKPVLEHGVNTLLKISLRGVALQLV